MNHETGLRFLNQPNPYNTGLVHGILPCFVGMEIRLLARVDADQGLVQDTLGGSACLLSRCGE